MLTKILYRNEISFPLTFASGFIFGLASLCRPSALPIGILVIFALYVLKTKKDNVKSIFAAAAVTVAGLFIAILPWTIYNKATTGEWILISDASGYVFWVGNHPDSLLLFEGDFSNSQEFKDYSNYVMTTLTQRKLGEFETKYNYSKLSLKQRENLWQTEAVENFRNNTFLTHRLLLGKAWSFWRPYLNPQAYSTTVALVSAVFLVPLYLLTIFALAKLWREPKSKKFIFLFVIFFLSVTVVHALTIAMTRYRVPYVEPYLSMFAGIGLMLLLPRKFSIYFLTGETPTKAAS
jgi:hypothetical protein